MKPILTKSPVSPQENHMEPEGDPFFLCKKPIVDPLFTSSEVPLNRRLAVPMAKLEGFLSHPNVETMELAQEGAATLCALMGKIKPLHSLGGRAIFRREFAAATLEQVNALQACEENVPVLKRILREGETDSSHQLSDPIVAGVGDLNESFQSRMRRRYSREGGLCDRLAQRFEGLIEHTHEVRDLNRRKTSQRFDGSQPAAKIREVMDPILAEARKAMLLVPTGGNLVSRFEERVSSTLARLGDYHFADAARLMEGFVGNMRELKHVFQAVECLEKKFGNRLKSPRMSRSQKPAVVPS